MLFWGTQCWIREAGQGGLIPGTPLSCLPPPAACAHSSCPGPFPAAPLPSHHLLVSLQVIYNQQSWRTGLISDIAIPSVLQK